ncbi:endonuclease/exonuclease/phosphatase family protein [Domibacillus robiginosus]|uniref:endonuclease/exonuclease/phosphatase family protein n=1 Tax=Domibacillus robiginosus TaxID=1071054 RepID=UPI00067D8327|nr:endonuclease/exonuclease/phosphatase family protein [Domibacillus robiginosus]
MKLLTLNCHSWQEQNPFEKLTELAETIAEKSYDVVALQEVSQSQEAGHANYAELLVQKLHMLGATDYTFVWDICHFGYNIYEEGVAIVTKHPVKSHSSFFITDHHDIHNWKTRKIVKASIDINGQPVSFFSCHLGWWHDEEEPAKKQLDRLLRNVSPNELAFLMGDFNGDASVRNENYDYLLSAGFQDTYILASQKDEGYTVKGKIDGWDGNKKDLRIDYIFVNQPVLVASSSVIFNGLNKPIVSDHFGVEVVIP